VGVVYGENSWKAEDQTSQGRKRRDFSFQRKAPGVIEENDDDGWVAMMIEELEWSGEEWRE